jgi:hypothetical protein
MNEAKHYYLERSFLVVPQPGHSSSVFSALLAGYLPRERILHGDPNVRHP